MIALDIQHDLLNTRDEMLPCRYRRARARKLNEMKTLTNHVSKTEAYVVSLNKK